MTPPRPVAATLAFSALIGLLGDSLLRVEPVGLNVFLCFAGVCMAAAVLAARVPELSLRLVGPPLLLVLFFGACLAWRDAPVLWTWNLLAGLGTSVLVIMRARGIRLREAGALTYGEGVAAAAWNGALGPALLVFADADWSSLPRAGRSRARRVLVGILLALPVAAVFGALLASADPGFARLVRSLLAWDPATLLSHLALAGFLAWISAGYLRALQEPELPDGWRERVRAPSGLGLLEVGIPLAVLALLFLAFLVLQARYLFGGEAIIRATSGLTYAQYARRGFFELVVASALIVPLLLAADGLLDHERRRDLTGFRLLTCLLLVLVGLLMASALWRMRLYLGAYGLTTSRVYAMTVLIWAALTLIWFAWTVLRGRRRRFAFGALACALGLLALLNSVNPEALVARMNLARARAGLELDVEYLATLGSDAVPTLVDAVDELPEPARAAILENLRQRRSATAEADWRTWSWSRWRARRAVAGILD